MLFILRVQWLPYFHFIRGFIFPCSSLFAFLGWEGGGSAFGAAVFALLGVSAVSVMRLVSSSSARLRGLCIRGGERPFVWLFAFGLSVRMAFLGSAFWGWAGCPERVFCVFWFCHRLLPCCLVEVVPGGGGFLVTVLLCMHRVCGSMVPVVGDWGLFCMWGVWVMGLLFGVLWVGVGGSAARAMSGGFECCGWAGCPDLVLTFSVFEFCGLGPQSRLEWLWCFVVGVVLRGRVLSVLMLLNVFDVSRSLVSVTVVGCGVFLCLG